MDFKPPELWTSNLWAIKCSPGKACNPKVHKNKLQTELIGTSALKKNPMTANTRKSDVPKQPQTEFLLFLFFAVSLVPPSGCLGLRGNPLYLHSVPHVLVVVLTVKIQDSLPTPFCRQLFLSSMWVSNIWTANPAVGMDEWRVMKGNAVKIHQGLHCLFRVYTMLHPHHKVSL